MMKANLISKWLPAHRLEMPSSILRHFSSACLAEQLLQRHVNRSLAVFESSMLAPGPQLSAVYSGGWLSGVFNCKPT